MEKSSEIIKDKSKKYLGTEDINKLFWKLSIPAIVAQVINMLYNMVDRIYIGHIREVGSLALTGVGVCMPILIIVSAFASFGAAGGAPRASIFLGKNDKETAEKILSGCFFMQIVISLALTAVLLIWGRNLLLSFGASENTISYAVDYLSIYAIGTIFVEVTLSMNAFITAQGDAKTAMLTVLLGAVINIILDPIFIFALDMGVRGAALATIISQGVSTIWVIHYLRSEKSYIKLKREYLFVDFKEYIWPCVLLGLATFIMQSSESILGVVFNSSLLKYGGDIAVGAMTILSTTMMFALLPLQAMGQGAQPITSYNFGAGKADRVKKSAFVLFKNSFIYAGVLWVLLMLFPQTFARIFTPDPKLLEFTAKALRIYCAALIGMGIQIACQMNLVATGAAKVSIVIAVFRKFIVLIPLIYIMPHIMENQLKSVYMAEPIADLIAVIFTVILFYRHFGKSLRELENAKSEEK
jgi:putative MATE family efflux protein